MSNSYKVIVHANDGFSYAVEVEQSAVYKTTDDRKFDSPEEAGKHQYALNKAAKWADHVAFFFYTLSFASGQVDTKQKCWAREASCVKDRYIKAATRVIELNPNLEIPAGYEP